MVLYTPPIPHRATPFATPALTKCCTPSPSLSSYHLYMYPFSLIFQRRYLVCISACVHVCCLLLLLRHMGGCKEIQKKTFTKLPFPFYAGQWKTVGDGDRGAVEVAAMRGNWKKIVSHKPLAKRPFATRLPTRHPSPATSLPPTPSKLATQIQTTKLAAWAFRWAPFGDGSEHC